MPNDHDDHTVDHDKLAADEALVNEGIWEKLRKTLGHVPFVEDALAAYYCATDGKTPMYVKAVLMGALAYFIVPTDVIPDFIAGIGYTDDAAVLAAAIGAVRSAMRPEHFDAARAFLTRTDEDDG